MDQIFPQIIATYPSVKRNMVWRALLSFGATGATPIALADRRIQNGKATGTIEGCVALLRPLLEELVGIQGTQRTKRAGERFVAFRANCQ
jgi:hypothetical protein